MAICPNCQAQVPDSARFCQECGARMPSQAPTEASAPSQPNVASEEVLSPDSPTIVDLSNPSSLETAEPSPAPDPQPEAQSAKAPEAETAASENQPESVPATPQEPSAPSYNTVLLPEITAEELEKQRAALEAKQQAEPPASPHATVVLPRVEVPEPPPFATVVLPRVEEPSEPASSTEAASANDGPASDAPAADPALTPPSSPSSPYGTPPAGTPPRYGTPPSGTTAPYGTPPSGTASPYGTPPYGVPPAQASYAAPTDTSQAKSSNKQLYWIVGGIGCMFLFLALICAIFAFVVLGNGLGQNESRPTPVAQAPTRVREVTQAPRPTIQPSDSAQTLFKDDFSDASTSSLKVASDSEIVYAFEDGGYAISVLVPRLIAWSAFETSFSDVYIQVESTLVEGPESAAASLIFRSQGRSDQDSNNFYVYNVTSDGRYNLELMRNNALETLIDWTPSSEIKPRGEMNLLGVGLQGDQISLYVNDVLLEEYTDANFTDGRIALAVNTFDEGGAKVVFDNFVVEAE